MGYDVIFFNGLNGCLDKYEHAAKQWSLLSLGSLGRDTNREERIRETKNKKGSYSEGPN